MKTKDIKEIMIVYSDNDYWRVWDWIGHMVISTLDFGALDTSEKIEDFIRSLIPTAVKFIMLSDEETSQADIDDDIEYCANVTFKYNFPPDDPDWTFKNSDTVIIDLVNKISYIN